MRANPRALSLAPSATLALNQKAKALAAQGRSIVNLTTGEPDFLTPERIRKAAVDAMERGETHYTAVRGILPLRQEIAKAASKTYGRSYAAANVIVSSGAKQCLYNLFFAMLRPGDEVVLFAPYWVSYSDIVTMNAGKAVVLSTELDRGFEPDLAKVEASLNGNTRAILLNSPCNPTGGVYSKAFFDGLAAILSRFPDVLVITDDIYGRLLYDGRAFESIGMHPAIDSERLVIVDGVSKTYAMTGWRLGWTLAPPAWIDLMDKIQSQTTSNPSSLSQWATLEALRGDGADVEEMRAAFEDRRDAMGRALGEIGLPMLKPGGAFYFFPKIRDYLGKSAEGFAVHDDVALCEYLLEQCGVAAVPGSAFGAPGFLRLSFASPEEELLEGARRLAEGLRRLA